MECGVGLLCVSFSFVFSLFNFFSFSLAVLLMTFGSPRVGNVDFAAEFDRLIPNTWRVNNLLDPVPKIPLMIMGYEHVGIKVCFF